MDLIILDLVSSNFTQFNNYFSNKKNIVVLALTPSAFYFLELNKIKYLSFHNLISIEKFQQDIFYFYKELLDSNSKNIFFKAFFRDVAQYVNYYYYIDNIINYIGTNNFTEIYYITDRGSNNNILDNSSSLLYKYINITKKINIEKKHILKKYNFSVLLKKIKNKFFYKNLKYDWLYINPKMSLKKITTNFLNITININLKKFKYIKHNELKFNILKNISFISPYMTFLDKDLYIKVLEYKKNNKKTYFFQHGSYLYKNIFIKYCEIELADINFVFNDYTKKLFEDLGAKKVYSVGSIIYNKPIKEKKKKYDFLYIIQGHDYTGNLQYVDFPNSLHSFDGYELYQRHKSIINSFGKKFKDKKIIIRVHPTVVTTGVYVPFWELAKPYPNVIIDVSIPIHNLIEKSKYIISDYFTTEFINRELHYKRDIILFQGAPTPLPKETIEDMRKMFILVDTINNLEDKIRNIERITKNRIRYDDIIEYYSSKKCDTKKVVREILKLDGT